MANDPKGNDNTTPDDEISEEILEDVSGGNDFGPEGII